MEDSKVELAAGLTYFYFVDEEEHLAQIHLVFVVVADELLVDLS